MPDYDIHTNVRYAPFERIDIGRDAARAPSAWWNQTLCAVNDSVVRLGVFEQGEFHWHRHEHEDEFFLVLEGRLMIDVEDDTKSIVLDPRQGYVVPRGAVHRIRVEERTVVLMVEASSITPTGD